MTLNLSEGPRGPIQRDGAPPKIRWFGGLVGTVRNESLARRVKAYSARTPLGVSLQVPWKSLVLEYPLLPNVAHLGEQPARQMLRNARIAWRGRTAGQPGRTVA